MILGANLLLILYGVDNVQAAARTAGQVAVVNMSVFYLGPHLSYQADLLNVSLPTMKQIHGGASVSLISMIVFHAAYLRPSQPLFTYPISEQFYGVIVCFYSSCKRA